jgi:hypothetical protein
MAKTLPDNVKQQVETAIAAFNAGLDYGYAARYRGQYVYLDRKNYFGSSTPIGRLKYTGDMQAWEFAIYKYSSERYDADDWLFPGANHLDGTVTGALKAGLEAYPS